MDANRLTRRQFLSASGAMLGYVAFTKMSSPGMLRADGSEEILAGVIEQVQSPRILKVHSFMNQSILIRFSDDAAFSRGYSGRVAGINDFVPGDEIVAEGQMESGGYIGTTLVSLYRAFEGRIVQQRGTSFQTSSGIIRLASQTSLLQGEGFVTKSLAELAVGDYVAGLAWHDPLSDDLIVLRIGVRGN